MAQVTRTAILQEIAEVRARTGDPVLCATTVAIYLEDALGVVLAPDLLESGSLCSLAEIQTLIAGLPEPS